MSLISNKLSISLLSNMLLIREVEEQISKRYKEQKMRCPIHLSIGQEATAVGFCAALNPQDKIFSNHRCHAHYLAKGGNLQKMISELHGKKDGCCAGRGGSMHLFDIKAGILNSIPIVGSSIPLATGSALSSKINKSKEISAVFFGDATVEEGAFHESMNFASTQKLPIVYVCENNLFSCYTHINERQPKRKIDQLGIAHKVKIFKCNGNDIEQAYKTSLKAINYSRKNICPSFIIFETYRFLEHCGPDNDNKLGYRNINEYNKWLKKDPIIIYQNRLLKKKIIKLSKLNFVKTKIKNQIKISFNKAEKSKLPNVKLASKFVYA